jgi:3'-phosphoadenosine 5'-phosphosulfate sulfotransferase (PAPS reductase)/FAD synthetase
MLEYVLTNQDDLEAMENEAIRYVRDVAKEYGRLYLAFSGGKDSIVTKKIMDISGVDYQAYYSSTGIDPKEVVLFIKEYHPDVVFLKPKMSFFEGCAKKGLPLRNQRWCCDVLKKNPGKSIKLGHRIMGLRAEESSKRAKRGQTEYQKKYKQWVYKPIFRWKEWHIWEYIQNYNLPYPSLYDEGFGRIGCMICPFMSKGNYLMSKLRYPGFFHAFENALFKLYHAKEREMSLDEYLMYPFWPTKKEREFEKRQLKLNFDVESELRYA